MDLGTRLGPYEILEPLGTGGTGKVFLGQDACLGAGCRSKCCQRSSLQRLACFEQETRAAATLNRLHVAAVRDIGATDGAHYAVQEYLQRQTLREVRILVEPGEGLSSDDLAFIERAVNTLVAGEARVRGVTDRRIEIPESGKRRFVMSSVREADRPFGHQGGIVR